MGERGSGVELLKRAATKLLEEATNGDLDHAAVRTQINRCELAFAISTRPLVEERCDEDRNPDGLTPCQALRYECRMASGAAAAAIEVGQMLDFLAQSRQALEAGRIGISHLNLIAYTGNWVGEGFSEDELLKKAEKLDVSAFAKACTRYRHQIDPERFADEERLSHYQRFLELTTNSETGCTWVRGFLDGESGATLRTAIEALARALPDDDRTAKQRRADALVEIARVALDEGKVPLVNGVRPHLQITATLETLLGLPGAPPAELEGAGPISIDMLRRLAGDCSLRRILLDSESMVIDVGRSRRTFSGATRLALELRDEGCVWPGCTRPARHCQGDHDPPWWAGGETKVKQGRLLCLYHHRLRSEGWELIDTEDGMLARPPIWAIGARE